MEQASPPDGDHLAEASAEEQAEGSMTPPTITDGATTTVAPSPSRLDRFRRWARLVTLGSIFLNALLGVWAVAGSLGEIESRILATSLLITACGVVAVACSTAIPEGRLGPVPGVGIAAAVLGFSLLIASFWEDFGSEAVWASGATLVIAASAAAYASLVSGVHLKGRYRRLLPTAYALAAATAAFLIAVVWGYSPGDAWRLFGIGGVLLAAVTLAIPTTARLRPSQEGPPPVRHCPFCGAEVAGGQERTTECSACGHRFRVVGR